MAGMNLFDKKMHQKIWQETHHAVTMEVFHLLTCFAIWLTKLIMLCVFLSVCVYIYIYITCSELCECLSNYTVFTYTHFDKKIY